MKRVLLDILACPVSGSPLTLLPGERQVGEEIVTGTLRSAEGRTYPIRHGIPRFVDRDAYVGSFSRQRQQVRAQFSRWRNEPGRREMFHRTTGMDPATLTNGLVLDAGCGYGRFMELFPAGVGVVGVDLSTESVELAHDYMAGQADRHVVQADLLHPPFRPECFDVIFSIGVLHHTPWPRAAFLGLIPHLKPGGNVAVWVYPPEMKRYEDLLRILTRRLPHGVLLVLCILRHLAYQLVRNMLGRLRGPLLGDFWVGVMGHYDSLAAQYAFSFTPDALRGWFEAAGLEQIRSHARRSACSGVKPGGATPCAGTPGSSPSVTITRQDPGVESRGDAPL